MKVKVKGMKIEVLRKKKFPSPFEGGGRGVEAKRMEEIFMRGHD